MTDPLKDLDAKIVSAIDKILERLEAIEKRLGPSVNEHADPYNTGDGTSGEFQEHFMN